MLLWLCGKCLVNNFVEKFVIKIVVVLSGLIKFCDNFIVI